MDRTAAAWRRSHRAAAPCRQHLVDRSLLEVVRPSRRAAEVLAVTVMTRNWPPSHREAPRQQRDREMAEAGSRHILAAEEADSHNNPAEAPDIRKKEPFDWQRLNREDPRHWKVR